MAEGKVPEQEAIDEIRHEVRNEALHALRDLELLLRADEGQGGIDAIMVGVTWQKLMEKVHVYRMTVNVGEEPTHRTQLPEADLLARGIHPRRCRALL